MEAIKKIIIVEDEKILGDILSKKLISSGYDVSLEVNGEAGLKKIKEIKPNLILLDLLMPKMDGYELLEIIKKDPEISEIPVIIISNSGYLVELDKAVTLGAKDYIIKADFNLNDVIDKVRKNIGGPKVETATEPSQQPKVLIVEDDVFLVSLAAKKFEKDGYRIVFAPDGEQAVRLIEQERPDIILLDLIIPKMNGFEVLKKIKEDNLLRHIPVIIFSNLGDDADIQKGKELGADDFFIKANFTLEEVSQKMHILIEKNKAKGEEASAPVVPPTEPTITPVA